MLWLTISTKLFGPTAPFGSGGSEPSAERPSNVRSIVGEDCWTTLDCSTVSGLPLAGGTGILCSGWSPLPVGGFETSAISGPGVSPCLTAFTGSFDGRGFATWTVCAPWRAVPIPATTSRPRTSGTTTATTRRNRPLLIFDLLQTCWAT